MHELGACRQQQQGEASAFREKPVDNNVSQSVSQTADHIAWHTYRCQRSRSTLSVPYVYDRQDCCSVRGYALLCYPMLSYANAVLCCAMLCARTVSVPSSSTVAGTTLHSHCPTSAICIPDRKHSIHACSSTFSR